MVIKNILSYLIAAIFLINFLSCVSVNKTEIIEIEHEADIEKPEQVIEYMKAEPETEIDSYILIQPDIMKPVSADSINENDTNDTDASILDNILLKPDIINLFEENQTGITGRQTEEEVVRNYLDQYSDTPPSYTDNIIPKETESSLKEDNNAIYNNTEVDYYTDTLLQDTKEEHENVGNDIFARIGDPITVNLEKEGWFFLGSDNNQQLNGLRLVSSEQAGGYSNFTFNALELGTYALKFLHQDNIRGTQTTDTIHVTVMSNSDFENKLSNTTIMDIPEVDYSYADALMNAGQYESAVTEYLKSYRDSSPYLNDRIAEAYWNLGNYSLSKQYWLNNIDTDKEYSEKAVIGIINASIASDDYSTVLRYANRINGISAINTAGVLINLTEFYKNRRDYESAIDTCNLFLSRYPTSRLIHKLYFIMGELYEENSSFRDFEKSIYYYKMIYENFPESTYSREARERVDYINRHFFYIR